MASASTEPPDPVTAVSEEDVFKKSMKPIGIKADDIDDQTILAVSLIMRNHKNKIVILSAKQDSYRNCPAEGIDPGEDHKTVVDREAIEETGCKIAVAGDYMATAQKYRGNLHRTSYCCCAELVEDTGVTALTDAGAADGLGWEWGLMARAMEMMEGCEPLT